MFGYTPTSRRTEDMKTRYFGLLLLVIVLGLALGGCSCMKQAAKGEVAPAQVTEEQPVVVPEAQKEEVASPKPVVTPPPSPAVAAATLQDIYFDFDKYSIRPGDAEILNKNYEWLKSNPNAKVRIEGNCDERGTVEYNMVLGQKRADAAKSYLTNLGANSKNLETVSYGKEKPIDPGHNEAAWAKNRRDHFTPLQ
jgi:peptidoglycan-associated lipoprotein